MEILVLAIIGAVGWFWFDTLSAREVALRHGRRVCHEEGLQLLDETVAVSALRLARDEDGRLRVQRLYDFEYSDTGNNRRKGQLTLLGRELTMIYTGPHLVPGAPTLH
ncbi:MAG: DUF3301 domain-containing protein [Rhodocyclaceae bacterium]